MVRPSVRPNGFAVGAFKLLRMCCQSVAQQCRNRRWSTYGGCYAQCPLRQTLSTFAKVEKEMLFTTDGRIERDGAANKSALWQHHPHYYYAGST